MPHTSSSVPCPPQAIAPEPPPPMLSDEPYLPSDLGQVQDQQALALPPILQQQQDVRPRGRGGAAA